MNADDIKFVRLAIEKAKDSVDQNGFPFGAVVVKNGRVIGEGISAGNKLHDPTSHGEIAAIREACTNLQTSDLGEATLYGSSQPCCMCFSAAMYSKISKIVFACAKEKISSEYYGGDYQISQINTQLLSPLTLQHCTELESEALALIHQWEKTLP